MCNLRIYGCLPSEWPGRPRDGHSFNIDLVMSRRETLVEHIALIRKSMNFCRLYVVPLPLVFLVDLSIAQGFLGSVRTSRLLFLNSFCGDSLLRMNVRCWLTLAVFRRVCVVIYIALDGPYHVYFLACKWAFLSTQIVGCAVVTVRV